MNPTGDVPFSSDEKLMGALAHLFGPFVALVVWSIQKDKSRFVRFQALQALAFDVILVVVTGIVFFCLLGVMFIGVFGPIFNSISSTPSPDQVGLFFMVPFMFPFMLMACIFPFSLVIMAVRLVASISVLNGRNYQYPILSKWLENFLAE